MTLRALTFLLLLTTTASADSFVYVAPTGDDANLGTLDRPLATLAAAQQRVRTLKTEPGDGTITVELAAGTYYLRQPIQFTPEDSGSATRPIEYRAADGATVVLSGGARLKLRWTPYRDGILRAVLPESLEPFDQLFLNGQRQHMARYPNFNAAILNYGGTAADAFSPQRAATWSNPAGGFIHAIHRARWGDYHYLITGKNENNEVQYEGGWQNNRQMGMHKDLRFVENILEELDAPGEWFLDPEQGTLYLFPPQDVDLDNALIEIARLERLFDFQGSMDDPVRHITLRGFTLRHTKRTFMKTREPLLRSDWAIYRGGAVFLTGVEDCALRDCHLDAVGGNAVFVSNYARRVEITGCKITQAGANGVCFVGDPAAVRSPSFEYHQFVPLAEMDVEPGPKTPNYPAQCLVHDNLMHSLGVVEKQTAAVQISMAEEITVSHNSIYHLPRAGINVSEGTWGGHLLEFNDVFDTVRETGDHGSFNSWGRDRFWSPDRAEMDAMNAADPEMPLWDARKTTVIRNNRWRCDHGWDVDLDDGSSNYHIHNNLCLHGGLKLREGFYRTVENNIMVGNSFHPHVWFENSGDVFRRNIVETWYRPIRIPTPWGKEVDYNLLPDEQALAQSRELGMDAHSTAGDPMFVDPASGDYRVRPGSPALALGFENFPMDQFGVVSPRLKAEAKTPELPQSGPAVEEGTDRSTQIHVWLGAKVMNVRGITLRPVER